MCILLHRSTAGVLSALVPQVELLQVELLQVELPQVELPQVELPQVLQQQT